MGICLIMNRVIEKGASPSPPTPTLLTPGETYSFGGYDWICAEIFNDYAVLQSKGVTHGQWPGVGLTYPNSCDGVDISTYNVAMTTLYSSISSAEYTSATYGEGLYLINKEKIENSIGHYREAILAAAQADTHGYVWLGTINTSNYRAYRIDRGGTISFQTTDGDYAVAPAFNVDLSKINVSSENVITIK